MPEMVSVIVPCYNEEDTLPLFYKELKETLSSANCDYELLLIDDGSSDSSLKVMKRLADDDDRVHYLAFSRNFGKEAALYAGFKHAKGDYVVAMDADLQHPPAILLDMLDIMRSEDVDSVAARREDRTGENRLTNWFAARFYRIINGNTDAEIVSGATDFRLMSRKMVDAVLSVDECIRFSKGIFSWVGFKTKWISYPNVLRVAGQTKWHFSKLARYAADGIFSFSRAPLGIVSWIGGVVAVGSLLAILIILLQSLFSRTPSLGWISLMCVMLFMGGVQMLCLSIMGQYMARIYTEVKKRPHYVVSETDMERIRPDFATTPNSDS